MSQPPGLVAQLRALRRERGLPLKVVAHDMGVSITWLCQIEHGSRRSRTPEFIERWARILGADVVVVTKPAPRKKRSA